MKHLSYDLICKIADGVSLDGLADYSAHLKSCKVCQREVELQRSIVVTSRRANLVNPSQNFTKNVLEILHPSKKNRWYDRLLQNMGNVIAMTSVLAFLAYIFSVASSSGLQIDKPSDSKLVAEATKYIAEGTRQIANFLTPKAILTKSGEFHIQTIIFGFIAFAVLLFIDRIAQGFFRRSRI
jgi:hypothetical protein